MHNQPDNLQVTTTSQQQQPPSTLHLQQSMAMSLSQPDQHSIQNIPPVMLGMVQQLQSTNLSGKNYNIISVHVPLTIKNKVWAYSYVDLGSLLESSTNPDEEEEYDLFPDKVSNKMS